jgi:hypothetical protein
MNCGILEIMDEETEFLLACCWYLTVAFGRHCPQLKPLVPLAYTYMALCRLYQGRPA